jgi:hypothetical protein
MELSGVRSSWLTRRRNDRFCLQRRRGGAARAGRAEAALARIGDTPFRGRRTAAHDLPRISAPGVYALGEKLTLGVAQSSPFRTLRMKFAATAFGAHAPVRARGTWLLRLPWWAVAVSAGGVRGSGRSPGRSSPLAYIGAAVRRVPRGGPRLACAILAWAAAGAGACSHRGGGPWRSVPDARRRGRCVPQGPWPRGGRGLAAVASGLDDLSSCRLPRASGLVGLLALAAGMGVAAGR